MICPTSCHKHVELLGREGRCPGRKINVRKK